MFELVSDDLRFRVLLVQKAGSLSKLSCTNEGREIRTPNLLIWSQTRCRCAIPPMNLNIILIRNYGRFKHARRRARDPARDLSPTLVRRSAEALQSPYLISAGTSSRHEALGRREVAHRGMLRFAAQDRS